MSPSRMLFLVGTVLLAAIAAALLYAGNGHAVPIPAPQPTPDAPGWVNP